MAKRPAAKWTGVIEVPTIDITIDGVFHSAQRRGRTPLSILQIHEECKTRLQTDRPPDDVPEKRVKDEVKQPTPTQVTRAVHCPSCNRALRIDEIGTAVDTELGLIPISASEREGLKPTKKKVVTVAIKKDVSSLLGTIGTGRRFYLFPKAHSVTDYYRLHTILKESNTVGFIQEIVIDRRTYVVVIRPIQTDPVVFGQSRKLLVVDEFADTDTLRDPDEYQLLPKEEPDISLDVRVQTVDARRHAQDIDPRQCVNPERRRFTELVQKKMDEITAAKGVL